MSGSIYTSEAYNAGLAVRKEVMGEAHVEKSLSSVSEFSAPWQTIVTEVAWGGIWTRPGLSRRERSILNLGMLTGLGRFAELAGHVRGALRNGVTVEEVRECLLQAG
jgi:4-carboxymuconolactone decarboxylase